MLYPGSVNPLEVKAIACYVIACVVHAEKMKDGERLFWGLDTLIIQAGKLLIVVCEAAKK